MEKYFEFQNPVKILAGKKALENLPFEFDQFNVKRPLFLTDKGVRKAGLVNIVEKACSDSDIIIADIIDDIPPDSSTQVVNRIAQIYKDKKCDALVAIGGGSVIDTAKGVNILVSEDATDLMDFVGADVLKRPLKPFFVIPTTAGTGSEVTLVAVIKDTDTDTKMAFTSKYLLPNVAILDPRMTLTLPPHITASTAMDALTHAIEAYTCLQKNPLSDAYAWKAIEFISNNLIDVVKDGNNVDKRLSLTIAATMAGIAFSNSMVGLVHSLGHATGAVCGVPHGVAMSIFLPHVLEHNLNKIENEVGELLLPLAGADAYAQTPKDERARNFILRIKKLQEELYKLTKLPRTLNEANVSRDKFEQIAQKAINDGSLIVNPTDITFEDALDILNKAYE
ncbi:MAG: iron-containing alcohol dehydrogenase [Candidatus Heimdallarchaeaceae archaeon]